ncbi:MAG: hypothetical protein K6T75_02990 [Acetobacteraceae bacterium]|nr:hypothetical protein [Acetobacteraceae bacterium]
MPVRPARAAGRAGREGAALWRPAVPGRVRARKEGGQARYRSVEAAECPAAGGCPVRVEFEAGGASRRVGGIL